MWHMTDIIGSFVSAYSTNIVFQRDIVDEVWGMRNPVSAYGAYIPGEEEKLFASIGGRFLLESGIGSRSCPRVAAMRRLSTIND